MKQYELAIKFLIRSHITRNRAITEFLDMSHPLCSLINGIYYYKTPLDRHVVVEPGRKGETK